ncbi:MAG: hypothetical protein E7668_05930 [Ruminococcaceae bacterium]|nr:hypothetical protein [Oscillospiraceae bacterium]
MKKRRTILITFLLVAALALGVGYAVLSDTLDITGSADVNQAAAEEAFNADILFKSATANDSGNTASVNSDNDDKASFTANNLKGQGDKATFTFVIENKGDLAVKVTPRVSSNTNEEYFSVSSDWQGATKDLAAGGTLTYTVTMELIKTPTETISGSCIIELTATAEAQTTANTEAQG